MIRYGITTGHNQANSPEGRNERKRKTGNERKELRVQRGWDGGVLNEGQHAKKNKNNNMLKNEPAVKIQKHSIIR